MVVLVMLLAVKRSGSVDAVVMLLAVAGSVRVTPLISSSVAETVTSK